jgi:predicted RNase H-like HicB family nuclease
MGEEYEQVSKRHYSSVIEWLDEDQAYVMRLPKWQGRVYQLVTDGATIEEAARKGQAAL